MANKTLFQSLVGKFIPPANTVNEAGGIAYKLEPKHALAQYAMTGCLNSTFYASGEIQLKAVLDLAKQVEPVFIAKLAIHARRDGFMKDMPALLLAILATRDGALLEQVFDQVIDNGKMLRNFVQILRSGVTGRKSLGSRPKRLVLRWIERQSDDQLFRASIGNDPSLADVIKMVHPKPSNAERTALYGYLIGREHDAAALPALVKQYENFKSAKDRSALDTPDVPFQFLTSLELSKDDWKAIARRAPWHMTRMNLNTFSRHEVFEDDELVRTIADRLRDYKQIVKAKVFPYQLMAAYKAAKDAMPASIANALQDAMEVATENVPSVPGRVYVFPDVSGSMHCPATGFRPGATSVVKCIDIAALVAAAIMRKNPHTIVMPFSDDVVDIGNNELNPRDSVMTNAQRLASLPSGGTNCSAPLAQLNSNRASVDLVVYVSDNESWRETSQSGNGLFKSTRTMKEWAEVKRRNPNAKMVCIDIQPYGTVQALERDDITHVGGFSDEVFDIISAVASGEATAGHWVSKIESVKLAR